MTEEVKVEAPKLNAAQQLAVRLGLPHETMKTQHIPKTTKRHRTFRSVAQLAVKKKAHARRVGRPK